MRLPLSLVFPSLPRAGIPLTRHVIGVQVSRADSSTRFRLSRSLFRLPRAMWCIILTIVTTTGSAAMQMTTIVATKHLSLAQDVGG